MDIAQFKTKQGVDRASMQVASAILRLPHWQLPSALHFQISKLYLLFELHTQLFSTKLLLVSLD